jgi:hemerythrin superfamily protein
MDAVELIKQDHERIEKLFGRFLETESETSQEDLYQEIQTGLALHAEMEERVLYPAMKPFAAAPVEKAIQHHIEVKEILAKLLDPDLDEQTCEYCITQLMEDVRRHIREEEAPDGILAAARQHLDADTLVEMAAHMTAIQNGSEHNLAA